MVGHASGRFERARDDGEGVVAEHVESDSCPTRLSDAAVAAMHGSEMAVRANS